MKKKTYSEDSDNEFEVDEPEELQENSDDEWAPAKGPNKRGSTGGKRGAPAKKKKRDSDDEEDEDVKGKKKGAKAKTPAKGKAKAKSKNRDEDEDEDDLNEEELEDEELDDEEVDEEEEDDEEETVNDGNVKTPKEFSSGAFVVLKSDFSNTDDPPIWKIDGKALLQKYIPYEQDGKTLYKNTSVYSGWNSNSKDKYYAATVVFKQQTRKEHVVEFQRDLIQKEDIPSAE